jgi:hypothetical protein
MPCSVRVETLDWSTMAVARTTMDIADNDYYVQFYLWGPPWLIRTCTGRVPNGEYRGGHDG